MMSPAVHDYCNMSMTVIPRSGPNFPQSPVDHDYCSTSMKMITEFANNLPHLHHSNISQIQDDDLMSPVVPRQNEKSMSIYRSATSVPAVVRTSSYQGDSIIPAIQNVVSTVDLGCKLNLKKICSQARNTEYNPKSHPAVIMRLKDHKTTALIFSTGKMVCTGGNSEEVSRLAARKYARIVQKLGFATKILNFKIQNMVGSCNVKFSIRLDALARGHEKFIKYEPELFPGLVYRMVKPKVVLKIFANGNVIITGAKTRQEIYDAFEIIYPILKGFKH
ncbi:hypothetical protein QYM36_017802 [Artemia franciscana]|uniref:TATA-box-binding protein n=2 Tax=Artemia franciscana TaxID=6661 RepID=A0AA88HE47_ARTSF|nr:hypothetical protein QYM36_017802 [Artemia franciscana]